MLALETEVALPAAEHRRRPKRCPIAEQIDQAAALLADAKQPLLFVGSGAVGARPRVLAIAEMLRGAGRQLHRRQGHRQRPPLSRPDRRSPGTSLWRDTDVVLAVGTRLNQPQMRWGSDRDLKLIRIDLDPVEITRIQRPALGIVADAKPALAALHQALERRNISRPSRRTSSRR